MRRNIIEVLGAKPEKINLYPASRLEEITQNIKMILSTVIGSVPLHRRFGVHGEFIDEPMPRGMMSLVIFITESIQEFEPRARVEDVAFTPDPARVLDGAVTPVVKVSISDEYLI